MSICWPWGQTPGSLSSECPRGRGHCLGHIGAFWTGVQQEAPGALVLTGLRLPLPKPNLDGKVAWSLGTPPAPLNAPVPQGASELRGPQARHAVPSTLCQGPQAQVSEASWTFCCSWEGVGSWNLNCIHRSLSRSPGPSHNNILGLWPPPPSFPGGGLSSSPYPPLPDGVPLMFLTHTGSQRDNICPSLPLSHTHVHTHHNPHNTHVHTQTHHTCTT